jgi:hypothetical protein
MKKRVKQEETIEKNKTTKKTKKEKKNSFFCDQIKLKMDATLSRSQPQAIQAIHVSHPSRSRRNRHPARLLQRMPRRLALRGV